MICLSLVVLVLVEVGSGKLDASTDFSELSGLSSRKLSSTALQYGRVLAKGIDSSDTVTPTRVNFAHTFTDPIVIPMVATHYYPNYVTYSLTSIDSSGFEVILESNSEGPFLKDHGYEQVSYFAIDVGQTLPVDMQAGKITLTGSSWNNVVFSHPFSEEPVVLASVQTRNDGKIVVVFIQNLDANGFEIAIRNLGSAGPGTQEVGWIAITKGTYDFGSQVEFGKTGNDINHIKQIISLSQSFSGIPVSVASITSVEGGQPCYLRGYVGAANDEIAMNIEETKAIDGWPGHKKEYVSWVAFYADLQGTEYDKTNSFCPSGFRTQGTKCLEESSFILHLTFDSKNDIIRDKTKNLPLQTGEDSSFYPNYKFTDPWVVHKRGYYFNGTSYIRFSEDHSFVFAPDFTVAVWLRHDGGSGYEVLLAKTSDQEIVELGIQAGRPKLKVLCSGNQHFEHLSSNSVQTKAWNLVYAQAYVKANNNYGISLTVNSNSDELDSGLQVFLSDTDSNYKMTIGSKFMSSSYQNFYKGFLYEMRIYNTKFNAGRLINPACTEGCSVCPAPLGECIPSCDIEERWTGGSYNDCSSCDNCPKGCLEHNPDCSSSCSYNCYQCTKDQGNCLQCMEGTYLENYECQKEYFHASLQVKQNNYLNLTFSSSLDTPLIQSDVKIILSDPSIQFTYSMEKVSNTQYDFALEFENNVPQGKRVILSFSDFSSIRSVQKKFLYEETLQGSLYEFKVYCQDLCELCQNTQVCLTCVDNSSFNASKCECDEGYYQSENRCFKTYFHSTLEVMWENHLNLTFSSNLSTPLLESDLKVTLGNIPLRYAMEKKSERVYYLALEFNQYIQKGEVVTLTFNSELRSTQKEFLYEKVLEGSLYQVVVDCTELCETCRTFEVCLSCVENASLNASKCLCNEGYSQNGRECQKEYFHASLQVKQNNYLNLTFSSDLNASLSQNDIKITLGDPSIQFTYSMEKNSKRSYYFSLEFNEYIQQGQGATLSFSNHSCIRSSDRKFLFEESLQGTLYEYDPGKQEEKQGTRIGSSVSEIGGSISLASGLAGSGASSFWSAINTIQILSLIPISGNPLTPKLKGFFRSFNDIGFMVNFFRILFGSGSTNNHQESYNHGYDSGLFLVNAGELLSTILALVLLWPIVSILSKVKIRFLRKKFQKLLEEYKYGVFVRFLLEGYLDLLVAGLIQLYLIPAFGVFFLVNYTLGIVFCLCLILLPALVFCLIRNNTELVLEPSENPRFHKCWGSLFYEFKKSKHSAQFYSLFLARRLLYVLNSMLMSSFPVAQAVINCFLMLVVFLYTAIVRPYSELILQVSNAIAEFGIFLVFLLITYFLTASKPYEEAFEALVLYTCFVVVGVQAFASVLVFVKHISYVIKSYKNRPKKVKHAKVIPERNEKPQPVENCHSETPGEVILTIDDIQEPEILPQRLELPETKDKTS